MLAEYRVCANLPDGVRPARATTQCWVRRARHIVTGRDYQATHKTYRDENESVARVASVDPAFDRTMTFAISASRAPATIYQRCAAILPEELPRSRRISFPTRIC